MRKCGLIISGLLVLSVIFRAALWSSRPRHHQGRSLQEWTRQLNDERADRRAQAVDAIVALGYEAVPELVRALRTHESRAQQLFAATVRRVPWVHFRTRNTVRLRAQAALALGRMGITAVAAAPQLIAALGDSSAYVREQAEIALIAIGPRVTPSLTNGLLAPTSTARCQAARILGRLGEAAATASPALIERLNDSYVEVRAASAEALGRIGQDPAQVVPALSRALHDPSGRVREQAAWAMNRFGGKAVLALPELIRALSDSHDAVRASAANALARIGASAAPAVPALVGNLHHASSPVRTSAARALGRIGFPSVTAVPALVRALQGQDFFTQMESARALGQIGPEAATAVPQLTMLLKEEPVALRVCAAEALGRMGEAARPAVPALLEALNNDHSGVGHTVVRALRMISPEIAGEFHTESE